MDSQLWIDVELIGHYVKQGLITASVMRMRSIDEFGNEYILRITLAEVWHPLGSLTAAFSSSA